MLQFMWSHRVGHDLVTEQAARGNQDPKSLLTIPDTDLINSEYLAITWLPK